MSEFLTSVFSSPLPLIILTVLLSVLSLILILVFGSKLQLDRQISGWPNTPGKIETAHVHKAVVQSGPSTATRNSTIYVPKIHYSYTVQGTLYQSDIIGNRPSYSDMGNGGAKRFIGHFAAGKTVPVYYNPADPGQAVLEKTLLSNLFGLFFGFVVGGLALCVVGWGLYSWLFAH
jgi:hypothetical protein